MGFFGSFTIRNVEGDRKRGEAVLKIFFDISKKNYPDEFKWTEEQFFAILDAYNKTSIVGIGFGVQLSDLPDNRIKDAMENVALESRGKIPKNPQVFIQALSERQQKFDLIAFEDVATQTAIDTAKLAEQGAKVALAGGAVYGLVKILAVLIPLYLTLKSKKGKA